MKAYKFKKCKGFQGITCCTICKRKDYECSVSLVNKLSIDPDSGQEYCIHYVFDELETKR